MLVGWLYEVVTEPVEPLMLYVTVAPEVVTVTFWSTPKSAVMFEFLLLEVLK